VWGYLTFFTAADALVALDVVGPALGLEVSRNGLIRLSRNLGAEKEGDLIYRPDIDDALLEVLGIERLPTRAPEEGKRPQSNLWRDGQRFFVWGGMPKLLTAAVWAGEAVAAKLRESQQQWVPSQNRRDEYLERVRELLTNMACKAVTSNRFPKQIEQMFETLVLAMAWQESCFRQFHEVKGRVVYLRSYNGTSVGIMQINERVWRGIYDLEQLRWNIHYNASSGGDIIARYINRYLLKKQERIAGFNDKRIAGVVYAMYNGGPRQFQSYLQRLERSDFYKSDRLFNEKYKWVVAGKWQQVAQCMGPERKL
jgi:hypothetical protein